MPGDGSAQLRATPFHLLPRKKRLARAALTAFTLYHLLAMLVNGAATNVKTHLAYVFGAYDDGAKMTNSWGMFGKPPAATHVIIEGESGDGVWRLLSSTRASDRSWKDRVRDLRLRKIQGKLADPADRARLGQYLLAYACRSEAVRNVRLVHEQHEERDDAGNVVRAASKATVLRRSCEPPAENASSGRPTPPRAPSGRFPMPRTVPPR